MHFNWIVRVVVVWSLTSPAILAAADNPAARWRTGVIDPRVRQVPADLRQALAQDPAPALEKLVIWLTQDVADDFHKVKRLHDWVADNVVYDAESYFSGAPGDSEWLGTLRARKSVCYGYCNLLAKMCEAAGFGCKVLTGYGRGYGFRTGQAEKPAEDSHAWNAVLIQERWYLIDVTWDAGHLDGREYRKAYSTAYLYARPNHFIYTHFPRETKWQMIAPAYTAEQFTDLPYLRGEFFEHGLSLETALHRVTAADQTMQFDLQVPDDIDLMAHLDDPSGQTQPQRTLLQREDTRCRVRMSFPQAGRWTLSLYSKRRTAAGSFGLCGEIGFQSRAGTPQRFPQTYAAYDSHHGCLYAPLDAPPATDKSVPFRIRVPDVDGVFLATGKDKWQPLRASPEDQTLYQLTSPVAAGASVQLVAKLPGAGNEYQVLVDFSAR